MKKILIIGLQKNTNLGDPVIADCTSYLVKKAAQELNIECAIEELDMMEEQYEALPDYDMLVFAGGGIIKYQYQKFYQYINDITRIADENNIPVLMAGVGVEGYDESNENCQNLKKALNRSCVKSITTRDDIDCLEQCYIERDGIETAQVADPAVWTRKVYQIEKNPESKVIGLGVVREGIFRSNGIDIGKDELFTLWSGIIHELENRNIQWKIFTNGWSSDMKFAINLMKHLNREAEMEEKVVPVPTHPEELVRTISDFKGVIAGRLHANIISYSLGIPSIGIVWNPKLKMWGERIGYPERFFEVEEWDAKQIVDQLMSAMEQGYHEDAREEFKDTIYRALKKQLKAYLLET